MRAQFLLCSQTVACNRNCKRSLAHSSFKYLFHSLHLLAEITFVRMSLVYLITLLLQLVGRSIDSGNETMKTDLTNTDSRNIRQVKRLESKNVLTGIREADPETSMRFLKHPPSPPVRLRSRSV